MKRGLKFAREKLEELYIGQSRSLSEISRMFGCSSTNILYWMKKFDIKRRPAYRKKIEVPKDVLGELYWRRGLTPTKIAEIFGIKNERTIRKKMEKEGIPRKSLSEANTKKFKAPFLGDLSEKAYLLGLRAGDFHAKQKDWTVRLQTSSTHIAQINLLKEALQKYGEIKIYLSKSKARNDEWFIYVDLDKSFDFLLKKPISIPSWVMSDDERFYNFLCAYSDCEGSFNVIKSHKNSVRFVFKIRSGDKKILEQIKVKLETQKYMPRFYLERERGTLAGYGRCEKDIYNLTIYRKCDVLTLCKNLLPLSKHGEKIRKMKLMLENEGNNAWDSIKPPWLKIRNNIQAELLKNQVTQERGLLLEQPTSSI